MKILYVTTLSGTINAFLVPHIKSLIELGHKVDIACNINRPIDKKLLESGCKVYEIDFQRSPLAKQNYKAYKKIKEVIKKENYDIIHTHTPVASFCVRLASRKMEQTKILYTAHGFHFFKGAPIKNWLLYYPMERILAHWTNCIITMNDEDFKIAQKMKLRKHGEVHYVNGVGIDFKKFKPRTEKEKSNYRIKYNYNEDDFILIYVGELSNRKNQYLLINTIKKLEGSIPNIKLLLVGSGPLEKKYKQLVYELSLEEKVEFLGFRKDIFNLMALSDVAVSSSTQEGLPVNIMEAMSIGLPLVVTNCRGNRDLVENNKNGFVIGNNNEELFANSIKKLHTSHEISRNYSENNIELIKRYSVESVVEELNEIYKIYTRPADKL